MAGEGIVGILRVILGMDTAQYEDGAKKAAKATESFGKKMLEIAGGIQLQKALEGTARALVSFGADALKTADNLFKMSQKTGIPVERLSALKHAAELSDVSIETLGKGFKNLSLEMGKAQTGSITPAAAAFQALGLNIKSFGGDADKAFTAFAEKISFLDDGMTKTNLSAAVFGKRFGPEMIPLLNQGRKGIEDTTEAARKLGLIISTETARNAETFNDRMRDLKSVVSGVALTALGPLSAGLAKLSTSLVELVNNSGFVAKAAEGLVRAFVLVYDNLKVLDALLGLFLAKLVITGLINFGMALVSLARAMATATLAVALMNVASLLTVARFAALAAIIALATGNLPTFTEALEKVGGAIAKMMPADTASTITNGLKQIGIDVTALTADLKALGLGFVDTDNAIDGVIATMAKLDTLRKGVIFDPEAAKRLQHFNQELAKMGVQARDVGGEFAGTLAPGFIQAATSLKLINEGGTNMKAILSLSTQQARDLNAALLLMEGTKLSQEFLTPWQTYSKELEKLNLLVQTHPQFAAVAAKESAKAAATMGAAYGMAAQSIVGPMASAFATLAGMNKRYAGAAKALAIGEAIVNTYVAANKAYAAFAYAPPLAIAAAAAAVAAGLANVAKLSATEFQTGGSFKVGGAGGIDSQLVAFKASPGEMVDVRRPNSSRGGPGVVQTIELRPPNPRDFFVQHVRELVETLNAAAPDGYIIKVA